MRLMILGALGAGLYLAMRTDDDASDPTSPAANADTPRGIRNNNPGNIEKGAPWQGLSADQSSDDRFAVFESPVWGIRALARVLQVYRNRDGIPGLGGPGVDTIREIISRWAPDTENNTDAYIRAVATATGLDTETPLQRADYFGVIKAIIKHENGIQPYPDDLIAEGIARAYA